MSGKKLSQPESETQSLKRKYDNVYVLATKLRSDLQSHPEGSDTHVKLKRKINRLKNQRAALKNTLTEMGFDFNEEKSMRTLSCCLDALEKIDKVLSTVYGRDVSREDKLTKKKHRAKKAKYLKTLESIKCSLPYEILEEKMDEWSSELKTIEARFSNKKPYSCKGLTEEEKINYVRRETLQELIVAMQVKVETGASGGKGGMQAKEDTEAAGDKEEVQAKEDTSASGGEWADEDVGVLEVEGKDEMFFQLESVAQDAEPTEFAKELGVLEVEGKDEMFLQPESVAQDAEPTEFAKELLALCAPDFGDE